MNTNLNKRPMGHIAHLRKPFKSINTHDYIITLIKRRKKNIIHFMKFIGSSFEKNLGKRRALLLNKLKDVLHATYVRMQCKR